MPLSGCTRLSRRAFLARASGVADHHEGARHDDDVVRIAPGGLCARLDVGIHALRGGHVADAGEHHLGRFAGQLTTGVGLASLHDDRPALHRPGDVQRPAGGKVFALVIEHMQFGRIRVNAAVDIADEGVVGPAVPQAGHHVVELARPAVAFVVFEVLLEAEVQGLVGVGGGDDVPGRAPAAQVIQRREQPRHVVGRVVGGGHGGDQADALGHGGQGRQQRHRRERGDGGAALQGIGRHVGHGQVVGHEERIELAVFELLRQALDQRPVEVGIRRAARVAPGSGVDADRAHEGTQVQHSGFAHGRSPSG